MTDFRTALKRQPGVAEALGYDAGLVIVDAFTRAGDAHATLAAQVASTRLLTGATGRLDAGKWRLAADVTVLRLKRSDFVFETTLTLD